MNDKKFLFFFLIDFENSIPYPAKKDKIETEQFFKRLKNSQPISYNKNDRTNDS